MSQNKAYEEAVQHIRQAEREQSIELDLSRLNLKSLLPRTAQLSALTRYRVKTEPSSPHRHSGITFVANSSIDRLTVAWSTSPP